jgi:hypothetical protein
MEFTLFEEDVPDPTNNLSLEAEDFTTASPDINIGANPAASGGEYIDSFSSNQFIEHVFEVTEAGTYDFILFAANRNRDDSIMDIEINGTLFDDVLITRSFDWSVYLETRIPDITLNEGLNTVRITQRRSLSSEPDKIEFELTAPLSINEFDVQNISVYPNPSHGVFNIKSNNQNLEYKLVNLQGQVLEIGSVSQSKVDFSKNAQGIYFLELNTGKKRFLKKIVVK